MNEIKWGSLNCHTKVSCMTEVGEANSNVQRSREISKNKKWYWCNDSFDTQKATLHLPWLDICVLKEWTLSNGDRSSFFCLLVGGEVDLGLPGLLGLQEHTSSCDSEEKTSKYYITRY